MSEPSLARGDMLGNSWHTPHRLSAHLLPQNSANLEMTLYASTVGLAGDELSPDLCCTGDAATDQ
jgi:hypothetical protein